MVHNLVRLVGRIKIQFTRPDKLSRNHFKSRIQQCNPWVFKIRQITRYTPWGQLIFTLRLLARQSRKYKLIKL
jgi:hypothetical protein